MNLSDLETPQIIEELSLSDILGQMRDALIKIAPEFSGYLESDPLLSPTADIVVQETQCARLIGVELVI